MRRFITQVLLFSTITFVLQFALSYVVTSNAKSTFKVDDDVHIAFLGNSHIECGVNDSIIPYSLNFGRSGERMEWVYSKVKLLLDANPQIDTIVIGFDNVLCFKDAKKEEVHMGHFSPYFLRTLSPNDILAIITKTSGKYSFDMCSKALNISKLYEVYREGGKGAKHLSMGRYEPSNRNKLQEAISRHTLSDNNFHKRFDDLSHYFLDKTIKLCNERNVSIIFVCAPQYKLIHQEDTLYREIHNTYYHDIPFLDYRTLDLPDSAFQDLDHLRANGATTFSLILRDDLRNQDL